MEHFGCSLFRTMVRLLSESELATNSFITSNLVSVKSIRTKKTRKLVDQECLTLPDLIEANMGENVQLLTIEPGSNTKEWIGGTLKSVKRHEAMSDDDTSTDASSLVAHPLQPTSVFHTRKLFL